MAALGAAMGTLRGCGCGVEMIPSGMRCLPARRSTVRVVAEVERRSQGRMKKAAKSSRAVDVSAASLNSALENAEGRVSSGKVLRSGEEEPEVVVEETKTPAQIPLGQLLMQTLKLDKAVDEVVGFMAPREKGDIRDVILMSFSFAVLVYISQRLVCLYCVVRHMAAHTF